MTPNISSSFFAIVLSVATSSAWALSHQQPLVSYPNYTGQYEGFTLILDERFDEFNGEIWKKGDGAVGGRGRNVKPENVEFKRQKGRLGPAVTPKADRSALLYSASDIDVLRQEQLEEHPFLGRVGPDILDRELTQQLVVERLRDPRFRNRALGGLYLDQGFLAGNGNYLRSEILWASRLAPARKPASLARAELETLARQTLQVARRSYRTRGVTVAPSLAKTLKSGGLSFQQYRFYVFGREGLPCHACGTAIERRTMGSRNLFTCPTCQPSD